MPIDEDVIRNLLAGMGENPDRIGLKDTPRRVVEMYDELIRLDDDPPKMTVFPKDQDGVDCDQMVVVSHIPFYSLCEHHLVPFHGVAHIGYIPDKWVVGLSKFARVVKHFAARPQVQERLTVQIADYITERLRPKGVAVFLSAEHMCMSMRGVQVHGTHTSTHAIRPTSESIDKTEFLRLIEAGKNG